MFNFYLYLSIILLCFPSNLAALSNPHWQYQMKPGMVLHAEHKALEPIKNVLRRSQVTNYNFEMELPIIYRLNYTALWGIIDWKITWYDIEYMPMVMDVESFHFDVVS